MVYKPLTVNPPLCFCVFFACCKGFKKSNTTIPHGDEVQIQGMLVSSHCPPANGPQWFQGGGQPWPQGGS
jgi:hypothetical protein